MASNIRVEILLSTFDGGAFISQQLQSLQAQTHADWVLWIRDDGSQDDTREICRQFAALDKRIRILDSDDERLGACQSFAWLLAHEAIKSSASYLMLCDQDDYWHSNKIEVSLKAMLEAEREAPASPVLVHSDLVVVDASLKPIAPSYWGYEHINPELNQLSRLLVQNTVTGCTAMINKPLLDMLGPIPDTAYMHDWWIALVATAFGKIVPVHQQLIDYRQHGSNVYGSQAYSRNIFRKSLILLRPDLLLKRKRQVLLLPLAQASSFLSAFGNRLEPQQRTLLQRFTSINEVGFFARKKIMITNRIFRQGFLLNLGLLLVV